MKQTRAMTARDAAVYFANRGSGKTAVEAAAIKTIEAMARRDWAVRVLDAWAASPQGAQWRSIDGGDGRFMCELVPAGSNDRRAYINSTPDAARLAAAEAVWPELPESVRNELGKRP